MRRKRSLHKPEFKAKVALTTIKGKMETSNNADSGWVLTRAPVVVTRIVGVKVKIGGI